MKKGFNCYADGTFTSPQKGFIEKVDTGTWLLKDCLPFDVKKYPYSLPIEDSNISITSEYDNENKSLTITVKKYGELYDCRGFTVSVFYDDPVIESENITIKPDMKEY